MQVFARIAQCKELCRGLGYRNPSIEWEISLNTHKRFVIMKSILSLVAVAALLVGANALAIDPAKLTQALASSDRSDADKELDAGRKPVQVLDYLGLEEGMTVMDVMAGGGWYTEVLSRAVGPNGKVLMQNSPASLARGTTEATVTARVSGRLNNVERVNRDLNDLGVAADSVDFIITNLNFHDVYNGNPEAAQNMLAALKTVLKPGGTLAIIDHIGNPGADNASLHRISKLDALRAVREAGFTVVDSDSQILSALNDDHTLSPFAQSLHRNTDRFILKLTK